MLVADCWAEADWTARARDLLDGDMSSSSEALVCSRVDACCWAPAADCWELAAICWLELATCWATSTMRNSGLWMPRAMRGPAPARWQPREDRRDDDVQHDALHVGHRLVLRARILRNAYHFRDQGVDGANGRFVGRGGRGNILVDGYYPSSSFV